MTASTRVSTLVGHARPRAGSMAGVADLNALAEAVRTAPGLLAKRDLAIIERLGAGIDGDDAALVAHGDGYLVVCGEAISPPFLLADPFGAGSAAVVTNVSDVRAMGGRPLGVVDMLVSPDRAHAETVLDGIAWASEKLGVPVVGGHLTLGHAPSLAASCTGFAQRAAARLRRAARRRPDRRVRDRRPVHERDAPVLHRAARPRSRAAADRRRGARRGGRAAASATPRATSRCRAIAGSLLQMIEGAGTGATLDLDALPRPHGAPIERWLLTFPSFGFLLAAPPGARRRRRSRRSRAAGSPAAACGRFDDTRVLRLAAGRPGGRCLGPRGDAAHRAGGRSGIAIGWCMTPT